MKELARKLLLIAIVLSSTQVITIPGIGLSIFQVALIIAIIICIIGLFEVRYISNGLYLRFAIIAAISSFIALQMSTYASWAKSYFLLGLLTALLCFFVPVYFERKDLPILCKSLIQSQYITIIFSVYSFYRFYFAGGIPSHISLLGGLYINLEEDFFSRGQAAGQIRLSLPYSTPPVLSVVMAICIVILLYDKEMFSRTKKWVLITVFTLVLILTGSRTGLIGLVFFLFLEAISYLIRNRNIPKWVFGAIFVTIIAGLIFLKVSGKSVFLQKYINRFLILFTEGSLLDNRHLLVPLDGILIWLSSAKNFILGIGFGSSFNMMGAHTFLPPYFLNSFVTWVTERGLLGLYLICSLIYMALMCRKCKSKMSSTEVALINGLCVSLITCMFYEVLICYFVIIVIACCFIVLQSHTRNMEEKTIEEYIDYNSHF